MNQNILFTLLSSLINLCIFFLLFLAGKALCVDQYFQACSEPPNCPDGQNIKFPFYIEQQKSFCGYPGFQISCNNRGNPLLKLSDDDYVIHEIFYNNQSLRVTNAVFDTNTTAANCINTPKFQNQSFPEVGFELLSNKTELFLLYNCNLSHAENLSQYKIDECGNESEENSILALYAENPVLGNASEKCRNVVVAPVDYIDNGGGDQIINDGEYTEAINQMLSNGFLLKWIASNCSVCEDSGGKCGFNHSTLHFKCFCPDRPHSGRCKTRNKSLPLKLGLGIGGPVILIIIISSLFIIWCRYRKKYASSDFLPRNISSDPSKSDLEGGSIYYGVPIFSYSELEEVTSNFDSDKLLGDGGFGTVYYGKLPDGREVAVKRLYEHNYRRVEQFMNEIEILTRLHHKNLVTLYGCTSRRSRELLLVYEFIPNGTVADHLHGDLAKPGSLPWPVRLSIATETASALVYLHASDIIHRDVKTNNILLDNNFCVKVADFGLSRLFPNDVTHVSTAPQGTPGYVDPEYHQCYQLTDKSDVYSFGVVLIELITSMPAVDTSRHRHEINLANLAINRIQKCEFNELIDPNLGYESDEEVRRMTTSVAELAFRCLQQDKEMRPTMDEVLEELKRIQTGEYKLDNPEETHDDNEVMKFVQPPPSPPDYHELALLKNIRLPPSPDSVTQKWVSSNTTPNASG